MAGNKLSPRQKMIGMMYLVLTALLALNISKEILDAFVTVNDGLEKTKHNFKEKNDDQYSDFEKSYGANPVKVKPYYDNAQEIRRSADGLVSYIDSIKVEIITGIEPDITKENATGKNQFGEDTIVNLKHVKVKDNYLFSTNLLVGGEPSAPKSGKYSAMELKENLEKFRELALTKVKKDGAIAHALNETFEFSDRKNASGVEEKWAAINFYGVPAAATITLLTKMQTDVRNAESDVVKYLFSQVDAESFKFNKLGSAVISPSNYIIQGDTFFAEVFLAAYDSTQQPRVALGKSIDSTTNKVVGDTIPVEIMNGKGLIKIPASATGDFTYQGIIEVKGPSGEFLPFPFETSYRVEKPSTTISATKMNVFYIGVDNPVDISASGVAKDKIQASMTNGTITKGSNGEWKVRVRKQGKAKISVTAEVDGERKNMGASEFRVKKIPTPIPMIGGIPSGAIKKDKLANTAGIVAKMENFDFEVRVVVSEYRLVYTQANGLAKEIDVKGPRFNATVQKVLRGLKRNSRVTFENIKAKMPDGENRTMSPVALKII